MIFIVSPSVGFKSFKISQVYISEFCKISLVMLMSFARVSGQISSENVTVNSVGFIYTKLESEIGDPI